MVIRVADTEGLNVFQEGSVLYKVGDIYNGEEVSVKALETECGIKEWRVGLIDSEPFLISNMVEDSKLESMYQKAKKIAPLAGIIYNTRIVSQETATKKISMIITRFGQLALPIGNLNASLNKPLKEFVVTEDINGKKYTLKDFPPSDSFNSYGLQNWRTGVQLIESNKKEIHNVVFLSEKIKASGAESVYASIKEEHDDAGILYSVMMKITNYTTNLELQSSFPKRSTVIIKRLETHFFKVSGLFRRKRVLEW